MIQNAWVGYVQRSYYQLKTTALAKLGVDLPLMTDHSESNPLIAFLSFWAGIAEHLNYYIDSRGKEAFITSARKFESALAHASQRGYRPRSTNPASVDLRFILSAPATVAVTIPMGTEVSTDTGIVFRTSQAGTIAIGAGDIFIPAQNKLLNAPFTVGTGTGAKNQKYVLGPDVVDNDIKVTVDGIVYLYVDYLGDYLAENVFTSSIDADGNTYILFGDGINGNIPVGGSEIEVTFFLSNGALGNVGAYQINSILSSVTVGGGLALTVTNVNSAGGGKDLDTLEDIKRNAVTLSLTANRAVTDADFLRLAESVSGVARASVFYSAADGYVSAYVVPTGGGMASTLLLKAVELYFEKLHMVQTPVRAFAAGIVQLILQVNVRAKSNYRNADVQADVTAALLEYGDVNHNEIKGKKNISDIYEVIETTEGVSSSDIVRLSYIPYAVPQGHTRQLVWTVEVQNPTVVASWRIVIGSSDFLFYRDNVFLGSQPYATTLDFTEIILSVTNSGYVNGDIFEFTTYPVNSNIEIRDLAIPILSAGNLTVNVTGGV